MSHMRPSISKARPSEDRTNNIWDRKPRRSSQLPQPEEQGEAEEYISRHRTRSVDNPMPYISLPDPTSTSKTDVKETDKSSRRKTMNAARDSTPQTEWINIKHYTVFLGGFDLELWWRWTNTTNRGGVIMALTLLTIAIINLAGGIWLIATSFSQKIPDPYVCRTEECSTSSIWLNNGINESVEACDNFYVFMCGSYKEGGEQGSFFMSLITQPTFKIELGKYNILGKILKNYRNDPKFDKHIKFFQNCLDFDKRKEHGLDAFVQRVERWLGTRNLQSIPTSVEEIAVNYFHSMGQASFINIAFNTYPFISIMEPAYRLQYFKFANTSEGYFRNDFLTLVIQNLLPLLMDRSTPFYRETVQEVVLGVDLMALTINNLYKYARTELDILDEVGPTEKVMKVFRTLTGLDKLCPPMGLQLDYFKVVDKFMNGEAYNVTYVTPTAKKFVLLFRACFGEEASKFTFTDYTFKYPKAAFVGLWLVDAFIEFVGGMDYKTIYTDWGFEEMNKSDSNWRSRNLSGLLWLITQYDDQYQCTDNMWNSLGYLPSIRFLMSTKKPHGPADFLLDTESEIRELYQWTREHFWELPRSQIEWKEELSARALLGRGLDVTVWLPLVGGMLDEAMDAFPLGDDFLENYIVGLEHTVAKAKSKWAGSPNYDSYTRWWGTGRPGLRDRDLFNPRWPTVNPARLVEKKGAAQTGDWERFLGRKQNNYMLFPMAIFDHDPQNQTTVLKHALITVPLIRTMLSLMDNSAWPQQYGAVTWDELLGEKPKSETNSGKNETFDYHNCSMLSIDKGLYNYTTVPSNSTEYTYDKAGLFLSVVVAKLAFKAFSEVRVRVGKHKFNFNLDEATQSVVVNRKLPGSVISKFSEEQLFFMGYARIVEKDAVDRAKHYQLEATFLHVLMQMDEFAEIWKCPNKSMMHNHGERRCFDWTPWKEP